MWEKLEDFIEESFGEKSTFTIFVTNIDFYKFAYELPFEMNLKNYERKVYLSTMIKVKNGWVTLESEVKEIDEIDEDEEDLRIAAEKLYRE